MNPTIEHALDHLRAQLNLLTAAVVSLEALRGAGISLPVNVTPLTAAPSDTSTTAKLCRESGWCGIDWGSEAPTVTSPPAKPARIKPARSRKPAPAAPAKPGKSLTVVETIRRFFADPANDGSYTTSQLRESLTALHPTMAGKIASASVHLIDLANRGELIREGTHKTAVYRRGKRLQPPGSTSIDTPRITPTKISPREEAYRTFRETIPAPAPSPLD